MSLVTCNYLQKDWSNPITIPILRSFLHGVEQQNMVSDYGPKGAFLLMRSGIVFLEFLTMRGKIVFRCYSLTFISQAFFNGRVVYAGLEDFRRGRTFWFFSLGTPQDGAGSILGQHVN